MKTRLLGIVVTAGMLAVGYVFWRSPGAPGSTTSTAAQQARGGQLVASIRAVPLSFNRLIYFVPVLNLFRVPARHLMEVHFAVAILAGSAAFAVGEACHWPVGLERQPKDAIAFYTTLAAAAMLGMAIIFTPIDPIKALYWSAVINGTCAVPLMVVMMQMTGRSEVMGKFPVRGWLRVLGWLATSTMVLSAVGLALHGPWSGIRALWRDRKRRRCPDEVRQKQMHRGQRSGRVRVH